LTIAIAIALAFVFVFELLLRAIIANRRLCTTRLCAACWTVLGALPPFGADAATIRAAIDLLKRHADTRPGLCPDYHHHPAAR
jgi:hypothetical protein